MDEFSVGDRVYWFDPDDDLCSGFGVVTAINDDGTIEVRKNDGGEVLALADELIHDYVHTYAEPQEEL